MTELYCFRDRKKENIEILSGFLLSIEINFAFAWFCIATRCDWLTKLAPLS